MPRTKTTPAPAGPERLVVTTFRLRPEQLAWLKREALERSIARGTGKADASEVLRELLTQAIGRTIVKRA